MKEKRKNPYQKLLDEIIEFCDQVKHRHQVFMFRYPISNIKAADSFRLDNLSERVKAAGQLGYDVVLEHNADGDLVAHYRKKVSIPFHWTR